MSSQPLSRDTVASRLSSLTATLEPSSPGVSDLRWRYRQAAAVLWHFDPLTLKPIGGDPPALEARLHLADDIPRGTQSNALWILAASVRKEALKRLRTQEEMRHALQMNPASSRDPYQQALEAYILGTPPSLDRLNIQELRSTAEVVGWLRELLPNLPSSEEMSHRVARANLLQPFRQLSGEGRFFGRREELDIVDRYLAASTTSLYEQPPLFVHGPGGIGKSALLARTILRSAEGDGPARHAFVHIDFDLTGPISEPLQVLMEAARQLAYQDADAGSRWNVMKTHWSAKLAAAPGGRGPHHRALTPRDRGELLRQFRSNLERHTGALLVMLDSFTEGQERRSEFVDALWRLLNELQGLCPTMRVVISGRERPAAFTVQELPLGGLETFAVEKLMDTLGIDDPDGVRTIAERVDGNPLSLRLAAEVIERDGVPGGISVPRSVAWIVLNRSKDLQGALYRRVLSQIQDPDVRRLTLSSFALRQLSAQLLTKILAGPCEVEVRTPEHAERLFEDVRRKLLLARVGSDGSLHHPSDVRRTLLEFLRQEDRERLEAIHARAVAHYSRQTDAGSRAEELYHRLSLGEEPRAPVVPEESQEGLRETVGDLPAAGQKYLASLLHFALDPETLARAELNQRERETHVEVQELVRQGRMDDALDRLRQHSERSPGSPLFLLEARVHQRLGRISDARRTVEEGLISSAPLGDGPVLVDLLTFLGNLDHETPDRTLTLENAYAIARRLQDLERMIEVGVALLGVSRRSPGDAALDDVAGDLRSAFPRIADARIARMPSLMRRLAVLLGSENPDLLKRVIRVVGLPHPIPAPQLKDLANLLAVTDAGRNVDVDASEQSNASDGAPRWGASSDEWLLYLSQARPQDVDLLVSSMLDGSPSDDALVGVTRILRSALVDSDGAASATGTNEPVGHPFFDALSYPLDRADAAALYQALYQTIRDSKRIDILYHQSGTGLLPLNLNAAPDIIWREALDKLTAARRFLKLCELLIGFPDLAGLHPLVEAVKNARSS